MRFSRHASTRAEQRGVALRGGEGARILLPRWLLAEVYGGRDHKGLRVYLAGDGLLVVVGGTVVTTVTPSRPADEIRAILLLHGMGFPRGDLL